MPRLKVCGLSDPKNFSEVVDQKPDLIGLNFYPSSKRYVGGSRSFSKPDDVKTVGIFVDEEISSVMQIAKSHSLDYLQLHGNESSLYCQKLKCSGFRIIKAFQVHMHFDFQVVEPFLNHCDFLLFDAAGDMPGGNGHAFAWDIMDYYPYQKPYFIAGGLNLQNIPLLLEKHLPQLYALDINSGFETSTGVKDIKKIKEVKRLLNATNSYR